MIYLNDQPVNITVFPDKTSQVWKLPEETFQLKYVTVRWQFENESEFIHLAQLATLLHHQGLQTTLFIDYLPYGRQDKDVSNQSTFGLEPFANLLNSLQFNKIYITDPHSHVATDLIQYSKALYPHNAVQFAYETTCSDLACYPDKGALEKYSKIYDFIHIYGEKVRDQSTGNILSYNVVGDAKGKKVLIVDDICDGGATFKLLTTELLNQGAKEVHLFVTHGLFTKGLQPLLDSGIKRIFTKDGEK
jgi:ribose-phosphate pyrophosphokinase